MEIIIELSIALSWDPTPFLFPMIKKEGQHLTGYQLSTNFTLNSLNTVWNLFFCLVSVESPTLLYLLDTHFAHINPTYSIARSILTFFKCCTCWFPRPKIVRLLSPWWRVRKCPNFMLKVKSILISFTSDLSLKIVNYVGVKNCIFAVIKIWASEYLNIMGIW